MELSAEPKAMEKPCLFVIQNIKKLQLGAWGPPQGRPNPELSNLATSTYCFEQKCNELTNIKGIQGGWWSWDHGEPTVYAHVLWMYTYIHDYTREALCYGCYCLITPRTLAIQLWRGASQRAGWGSWMATSSSGRNRAEWVWTPKGIEMQLLGVSNPRMQSPDRHCEESALGSPGRTYLKPPQWFRAVTPRATSWQLPKVRAPESNHTCLTSTRGCLPIFLCPLPSSFIHLFICLFWF